MMETKQNTHRQQHGLNILITCSDFTNLPGGGCEGLKLARKKGGGGIAL